MLVKLHNFPGMTCLAVTALTVEAVRISADSLRLTYRLTGELEALRIPVPASVHAPTPLLWQHTCFELFFREPGVDGYDEYNFSPSLNWDHYGFSAYRQPLAEAAKQAPTLTILQHDARQFVLQALIPLPTSAPLDVAITAVIEEAAGGKTYWALAHSADKPDFHAPDGFSLRI